MFLQQLLNSLPEYKGASMSDEEICSWFRENRLQTCVDCQSYSCFSVCKMFEMQDLINFTTISIQELLEEATWLA
jgi:hypothetical protein